MTGDLAAMLISDEAAFAALEPAWWALWRRCPEATPFISPAWALPWWRIFAPGTLRVGAVFRGTRLVALAPFYREDAPGLSRLLPVGIGISDALDILTDPAEGATGRILVETVASGGEDWDRWDMEELGPSAAALTLPCPDGCREELRDQNASPVLALTGPDALVALPARKRRKLRMAQNRVARRHGRVQAVAPADVASFLADLGRLHGARWTERGEPGVLADDPVRRFHAIALPGLVEADLARLFTLTIADTVVGAYYGLQHGARAYAYLGGFDPDFAFESPGTILIGHAIAEAAGSGAVAFDFLRGREAYKYEWGAVDRWTRRRSFVRDDARGGPA